MATMEPQSIRKLRKWFNGSKNDQFTTDELSHLILLRIADRVTDDVNESGGKIKLRRRPYHYDLDRVSEVEELNPTETRKISARLVHEGWAVARARSPQKLALTASGWEKAQAINDDIFNNQLADESDWLLGSTELLEDWLIVHGHNAFSIGLPYAAAGMINFRLVADQHPSFVSNLDLERALHNLEVRDLIMEDTGPSEGKHWAYFNTGGIERAELLGQMWRMRTQLPATNRYVRLDDNSAKFQTAVSHLEQLISEAHEIRVNDWPEKEGMLQTLRGALSMLQTKYVNRDTILAAVSSVVTFLTIKFAEAPIAELANKTWAAVKSLF